MLRRICKFLVRQLTTKGELHRAVLRRTRTASGRRSGLSAQLVADIAKSLARSSQLEEVKSVVFGSKPFAVDDVLKAIICVKKISDVNVVAALGWSLQILSTVNAVHMKVARLQQQQYDKENPEHVALLDSLWRALKPGTRREDWGEIGFQNGLVPESDFRGMGMLGLHQLVHFSEKHNHEAILVLTQSYHPQRYFPFAAAGINVTAFTSGMLEQRRLDERLYEVLVQLMPAGKLSESPSDEALASAGLADVHEFYGAEYVEFSRFWHESLPDNAMAFPGIFGTIKDRSNARFPRLVEDHYW